MVYIPILGALSLAAGTIMEKIILKSRKVNIRLYQVAQFLGIIIVMIPFIYFFWEMQSAALELKNILILLGVIIFSIIANMLMFYSMKWEKITRIEPAKMLEPLFVILLAIAFSFFAPKLYDRNLKVIIPALIAGAALAFSHIKKHHLKFNKYFITAIFGSLFFALELVISMLILDFYSPISFYFVRSFGIFLISFAIFRPKFEKLDAKVRLEILATAVLWLLYRIIVYYGYLNLGVIFTTLIIMLSPIFIYILAWKFLKEKLRWRNIAASLIIIASVLYAVIA